MSDGVSPDAPSVGSSTEDLAQLFGVGVPVPEPLPNRGSLRRKLIIAILIAGVGVGASFMSCIGQSFSLRQARALEEIAQQLKEIRASCSAAPVSREVSR
jgi:hypothetical protein